MLRIPGPTPVVDSIYDALAEKGLIVAGALAHLTGKAFRIGHMGNTTEEMLEKAIILIGETMIDQGFEADPKKAADKFREIAMPIV